MFEEFQVFVAVATEKNFSRAAEKLGTAASSVTRKIEQLESALSARLFHRTTRSISLTEAGEALLPRARAIIASMEEAREAVASIQAEPRGWLRITAPSAFSRLHVVPAVQSFLQRFPRILIDLEATDRVSDLIAERLDLAIRIGAMPSSKLVASRLADQTRIACASPSYLARRGMPASPLELMEHDCLTTRSSPAPSGWWKFARINDNKALAVKGPFRSDDPGALVEAAVAGLGVVHLASWLIGRELADGTLLPLFGGTEQAVQDDAAIYAVRLSSRMQAAKASLFVEHLRRFIGNPPQWNRAR
jgi:DNA-binding transcriptional LysR family regulator